MKIYLFVLVSVIILSFVSCKSKGEKELLQFGPFPLPVPEQNSLMVKWEKKPVLDKKLLAGMMQEIFRRDHGVQRWQSLLRCPTLKTLI